MRTQKNPKIRSLLIASTTSGFSNSEVYQYLFDSYQWKKVEKMIAQI
jgi:hypothetical protein